MSWLGEHVGGELVTSNSATQGHCDHQPHPAVTPREPEQPRGAWTTTTAPRCNASSIRRDGFAPSLLE